MAFEKEIFEIVEIQQEAEKLKERINKFSYEIETDDVYKATKQVKTLYNTLGRIINHLATLTTNEEFKAYCDNRLETYKKEVNLEFSLKKVRKALHYNNMIDAMSLRLNGITEDDINRVCESFGIDWCTGNHGYFNWIHFKKDEKLLTSDDMIEIGLLLPRPERKTNEEVIEEKNEDVKEEKEIMPFGWLSPTAEFTEGDFGDHEEKAHEIIKKKGFHDEYKEWRKENSGLLGRDFLVKVKGYVLLHNPMLGGLGETIASYEKQPTKKQCEFLFDYYSRENDMAQANRFINMIG